MKPYVAVCLYGKLGKYNSNKNQLPKDCKYALKSLFEKVLGDVKFDIFAHTWSDQYISKTMKYINPTRYCITPPINFSNISILDQYLLVLPSIKKGFKKFILHLNETTKHLNFKNNWLNAIYHKYYSAAISTFLMKDYMELNNLKYTHVLSTRYDVEYFTKFNFDELKNDFIYFGGSCQLFSSKTNKEIPIRYYSQKLKKKKSLILNKVDYVHNQNVLEDFWFISNFENSLIMADIFQNIDSYIKKGIRVNAHHLLAHHFFEKFSSDKICFYKNRLIDYELSRRYRLNDPN